MKIRVFCIVSALVCAQVVLVGQTQRVLENYDRPPLIRPDSTSIRSIDRPVEQQITAQASSIFDAIQKGIATGELDILSKHFARQVYVSLRGVETGYFSANQSFYILQKFFGARRTINFRFSTMGESEDIVYATGGGVFGFRGSRETLQVYVSLSQDGKRFVISQFNVY